MEVCSSYRQFHMYTFASHDSMSTAHQMGPMQCKPLYM